MSDIKLALTSSNQLLQDIDRLQQQILATGSKLLKDSALMICCTAQQHRFYVQLPNIAMLLLLLLLLC